MPKKYDGPIDRNTDFTHAGPNGEPASGYAVQTYIKKIDSTKVGVLLKQGYSYLMFADEQARDEYLADPSHTELILGRIDTESPYKILYNLTSPEGGFAPVFIGSVGNYIQYTYWTEDEEHVHLVETVDADYTIEGGGSTVEVHEVYAGGSVSFNVDKYLKAGNNVISVTLTGRTSGAIRTFGVIFQAIDISISDNFDISHPYSVGDSLVVSGHITGSGTRYIEWCVDGEKVDDTVIQGTGAVDYSKTISLSGLGRGRHNLQYRAYVLVQGMTPFYSNTLYRDFVIDDENLHGVTILTAFESPKEAGIVDVSEQPIELVGPVQYESFVIKYAIYAKPDHGSENLIITLGSKSSEYVVSNNHIYEYEIRELNDGQKTLEFSCGQSSLEYAVTIAASTYDLDPITDTQFEFSGSDRTNTSEDKDTWSFRSYTARLTGFDWTDASGWNGNRLVIPAGALFATDNFAPFGNDIKSTGYTFEMEFSTSRVADENAVVLDLTTNGRGLKITASEISFTSRGVSVGTKYKPDENVRVSIVINSSDSGDYSGFIFIYVDGVMTGAVTYEPGDSFISSKKLRIGGTSDATISVKQIRSYARPLSSNEIVNNFILYRDTTAELVNAYDRNDIYDETGTYVSSDKLASATPIIIITGNVNKLQNFGKDDKGTYVRMDKIEVINMQDPTKNLILINPSMRCQGTSSMEYPRKNFRFYTQADSKDETQPPYVTRMYDYQGREYTRGDRLYAFRDNAQRVSCWCLKADYAESSSTHNTGVARLWNECMKNASINDIDERFYLTSLFPDSKTPCKTIAQHIAEEEGYGYDVRTTVDGFPIALFFHENESDPLTFLGRYNWNNDKSTESVYGFKGIPNFDNSKVECWEVVNGDYPCNLFTDLSRWRSTGNNGWRKSFEARYPDDHGKPAEAVRGDDYNGALYRVSSWINSTLGASKVQDGHIVVDNQVKMDKFSSEKWDHLDVYKVAAYYVYLMRFGAVDQTVKNAMFTTEDGDHWFYINYDNDTINGVDNTGKLTIEYTADRQTPVPGAPDSYRYAGHSSVLWNNLEADEEFMDIVRIVDNALYKAQLTYEKVIEMFNEKQSAKWSEKTHNEDYAYKYINISDRTQLPKLQGPRKSHRQWWLSNRFAVYDAIFGTESYINNNIGVKTVSASVHENEYVTVTPAVNNQIFGYGYEKPVETGIPGTKDVPIRFDMTQPYYIGYLIKFYNAVYFKEINFSKICQYIDELFITNVNTAAFDTQLTRFILNDDSNNQNAVMTKIENLKNFKYLEDIIIVNFKNITSISLDENQYLKSVNLSGCSSLGIVNLPVAAPLESIIYPESITSIHIEDLVSLTSLTIEGYGEELQDIYISNCPRICTSPDLVLDWIDHRSSSIEDEDCSVFIDHINWRNVDPEDLIKIGQIKVNGGDLTLLGEVSITYTNQQIAEQLAAIFGTQSFMPGSGLYISAPNAIYVSGDAVVPEGNTAQYTAIVFSAQTGTVEWSVSDTRTGVSIDDETGLLTALETGDATSNVTVTATFSTGTGITRTQTMTVQIKKLVYPTEEQVSISGYPLIEDSDSQFLVEYSITGVDGHMTAVWSISSGLQPYVSFRSQSVEGCVLYKSQDISSMAETGTLYLTLTKTYSGELIGTIEKTIQVVNDDVAISVAVNPYAMEVMNNNHLCAHSDYMTKAEAALVTEQQINSGASYSTSIFYNNTNFRTNCTNFDEFRYFTNIQTLPSYTFYYCYRMESIRFSDNLWYINDNAFVGCNALREIDFIDNVRTIGANVFESVHSIRIGASLFSIGNLGVHGDSSSNFSSITVSPENQVYSDGGGGNCIVETATGTLVVACHNTVIPNIVNIIAGSAFYKLYNLSSIIIPSSVITIKTYAFNQCNILRYITFNEGIRNIEFHAFYGLSPAVEDILLPSTISSLAGGSFAGLGSGRVIVNNNNPYYHNGTNCIIETASNTLVLGYRGVVIPNYVVHIGDYAINGDYYINSLDVPSLVESIGSNSLISTTLRTYIFRSTTPPTLGVGALANVSYLQHIYVPSESVNAYKTASRWSDYASKIEAISE